MGEPADAFFAGRLFVPGEQNGYRFFLWGSITIPDGKGYSGEIRFSHTVAEPADGAFLCRLESGWIFVVGVRRNSPFRNAFTDDSAQADANAAAMHRLGVPILTLQEAQEKAKADGIPLYSVTAEERKSR
ncbi:MAG: hypothetical protein CVV05_01625 [Gammaproteobacteria bacterium HGW-Gammaproteobacteria-1]|nr:MAG: hypothetical protein CVV05_01625 [Gammaproteobacteria bacterium HGW-Gammaproteobacteria-1]